MNLMFKYLPTVVLADDLFEKCTSEIDFMVFVRIILHTWVDKRVVAGKCDRVQFSNECVGVIIIVIC